MHPFLKAARWGALPLIVASTGCVKIDTEPAPAVFHCADPGRVPRSNGSGWDCVDPATLPIQAASAQSADHAADAGSADYADTADRADLAFGLTGSDATLDITDAGTPSSPVQIDAPFHIQGFPVPSRVLVSTLSAYSVSAGGQLIESFPVTVPQGARVHVRLWGQVFSAVTPPGWERCDLIVSGSLQGTAHEVGRLAVSTNTLGAQVYLDRMVDNVDSISVGMEENGVVLPAGQSSNAQCAPQTTHDLYIQLEVVR